MKKFIISVLFIALSFLIESCNTTEPPPERTLSLKLEDVSCIEAWINLTTTNLPLPTTITIRQIDQAGNTKSQIINLITQDSLFYVDSLLPNQTYNFNAAIQSAPGGGQASNHSSNELSVTTMDTTSHNFTFESWTFGEHSSSVLYDVAIINENNIIAVGEIYMNDSLGQPNPNAYNVVRWNGSEWTIGRIAFTGGCHIIYPPIRSIWAFSENDIWFASGGSLVHFNGSEYYNDCSMNSIITPPLNKIWGTSSSDLYVVGAGGTIIRYNGTLWWRMGTITDLTIYDILGELGDDGEYQVLCIASNSDLFTDSSKVLKVEKTLKEINNDGLPIFISSIWFVPERKYFIAGDGLYTSNHLKQKWLRDYTMPPYYKTCIRGNGFNDIIMVGAFGLLMHFNGISWINYNALPSFNGSYSELQIKGNIIGCTGGLNDGQAIVTFGRR